MQKIHMMQDKGQNIISGWITWHYSTMPALLLEIWKNYLAFCADFFSIPLLLATLISPWRHEVMPKKQGFDIGEFFSGIIYNTFSRLMGAMVRLVIIVFGIAALIFTFFAGVVIFTGFVLMPLLLPVLTVLFFYV